MRKPDNQNYKKYRFLDNHLKGTSQSQKMMRFVIGG